LRDYGTAATEPKSFHGGSAAGAHKLWRGVDRATENLGAALTARLKNPCAVSAAQPTAWTVVDHPPHAKYVRP
jgi:hypothetical protein